MLFLRKQQLTHILTMQNIVLFQALTSIEEIRAIL